MLRNVTKLFREKQDLRKNAALRVVFVAYLYNESFLAHWLIYRSTIPNWDREPVYSRFTLWKTWTVLWRKGQAAVEILWNWCGKQPRKIRIANFF